MIELIDKSKRNVICAVIYKHLHGNISTFMDYLNSTIDKVHIERKHCVIMGDFNIDLLKYEEHQQSDEFINAQRQSIDSIEPAY